MTKKVEHIKWIVCGRSIGSASGWDRSDTFDMMLYDFKGAESYVGPMGDVLFRFENGTIESFNEDGTVDQSVDLINAIRNCPVARCD